MSFFTPLRLCVPLFRFFALGLLMQNQIVKRENKNPDQINQVPVETGILEDDKIISIHPVALDQKHGPDQKQGTDNYVQAMQSSGQVIEIEKNHFAGLHLF